MLFRSLFYSVEGKNYYVLTKWKVYQKLDRPTPSKIPDPPNEQSVGERGSYTQNPKLDECSTNARRMLDECSTLIEKNRNKNRIEERDARASNGTPTLDDITAYCKKRNNNVSPQRFFDYYSANGWTIGGQPIRDWQAAVRRWESNGFDKSIDEQPRDRKSVV